MEENVKTYNTYLLVVIVTNIVIVNLIAIIFLNRAGQSGSYSNFSSIIVTFLYLASIGVSLAMALTGFRKSFNKGGNPQELLSMLHKSTARSLTITGISALLLAVYFTLVVF